MSGGFWYLATPFRGYTGTRVSAPSVRLHDAAHEASRLAARLIDAGVDVYSPIAHSHMIAAFVTAFDGYSDKWLDLQGPFMHAAKGLLIGLLPGWDTSKGVTYETKRFIASAKHIYLVHPDFTELPKGVQR